MASAKLSQSLSKALQDMVEERTRLDEAIDKLQSFMGQFDGQAIDRPAIKVAAATTIDEDGTKTVRRRWTAEGRKAAAERMRKYWANRRKASGVASPKKGKKQQQQQRMQAATTSSRSKSWSPAARKEAAERMRKYWADRRKASGAAD